MGYLDHQVSLEVSPALQIKIACSDIFSEIVTKVHVRNDPLLSPSLLWKKRCFHHKPLENNGSQNDLREPHVCFPTG